MAIEKDQEVQGPIKRGVGWEMKSCRQIEEGTRRRERPGAHFRRLNRAKDIIGR